MDYHVKQEPCEDSPSSPECERPRNNCMDVEAPSDDCFLYCEDCNKEYEGDCSVHGPLLMVTDTQEAPGSADRAWKTMPVGLEIEESGIPGVGLGVYASQDFVPRTCFGPYEGDVITDEVTAHGSGYSWQIHAVGQPSHFVDGQNCNTANWMRYVNCARTEEEQNLTAFQYNGRIYYKVYKKIGVGSELLVWYGHKYARDLGIERKLKFAERLTKDTYPCDRCDLGFPSVVFLWKHLKKMHGGKLTAQLRFTVNTQGVRVRDFIGVLESQHQKDSDPKDINTADINGDSKSQEQNIDTQDITTADITGERKIQEQNSDPQHVDIRDSDNNEDRSNGGEGASTESNDAQTHGHHQGGNLQKCCKCVKEYTTKSKLRAHRCLRIVKPFSCEECGKTFTQFSERQTHMSVHTAVEPYSCKFRECGKTFALLGTLKQHMLRNHSGEKPFKCKECEKTFTYLSRLKTHMMTHNRGRPYSCSECGQTFARVQNMNSHKMVHSRIPHSCEECGKTFRQFGQLKVHMVSHSGVRPYTCEECGKTYKRSQQLLVHMVSHSDVKPFPCFLCEKAYTRSNYLKKHLVTHE